LKRYKPPDIGHIPAQLIEEGGETSRSVIHKLVNSILNKELPHHWKEPICTNLRDGR
jgi:hypothetical protein